MGFFFWSVHGETLFLARALADEGEDVTLYSKAPEARTVGKGIVPLVRTPQVGPDDLVIFDAVGLGVQGTALRRQGHQVIGGNPLDRDLELDRTIGTKLMVEHGIAVPETRSFGDVASAIRFLEKNEGAWFFKPSGNQGTSFTTGSKTSADAIRFLRWAEPQLRGVSAFELQRTVEGTEVSCEGWFDGTRFVPPFNSTFEDKKFLTGNLGPNTGCQSNVVWIWEDDAPLPAATVARLEDLLRVSRYCGPIDLNMIVDATGEPHGLEWTARTGFDALQAYTRLLKPPIGEQLRAFAEGRLHRWEFIDEPLALTLRISVPPYPLEDANAAAEMQGLPLDRAILGDPDRLLIDDVMVDKNGPALAGRDGGVVVVAAVGNDIVHLRDQALERAKSLAIRSAQYRTDPVERAEHDWAALRDAGFGAPDA